MHYAHKRSMQIGGVQWMLPLYEYSRPTYQSLMMTSEDHTTKAFIILSILLLETKVGLHVCSRLIHLTFYIGLL